MELFKPFSYYQRLREQHPRIDYAQTVLTIGLFSALIAPNPESAVTVAAALFGFSTARKIVRHFCRPIIDLGITAGVLAITLASTNLETINTKIDQTANKGAKLLDSVPIIGHTYSQIPHFLSSLNPEQTATLLAGITLTPPTLRLLKQYRHSPRSD